MSLATSGPCLARLPRCVCTHVIHGFHRVYRAQNSKWGLKQLHARGYSVSPSMASQMLNAQYNKYLGCSTVSLMTNSMAVPPSKISGRETCMRYFTNRSNHTFTKSILKSMVNRVAKDALKFAPSKRADEHQVSGSTAIPKNGENLAQRSVSPEMMNEAGCNSPYLIDKPVLDIPNPLSIDDFFLTHLEP